MWENDSGGRLGRGTLRWLEGWTLLWALTLAMEREMTAPTTVKDRVRAHRARRRGGVIRITSLDLYPQDIDHLVRDRYLKTGRRQEPAAIKAAVERLIAGLAVEDHPEKQVTRQACPGKQRYAPGNSVTVTALRGHPRTG